MSVIDHEYYTSVPANSFSERLLVLARDRIYQDFIARMTPNPSDRILDVGVSDVINSGANALERSYPHLRNVTACGLGAGHDFGRAFPDVDYRQIEPNTLLPFANGSFDIAASNAVLEHVGSLDHQFLFVSELCRVARRVFITVPNRFFPVEHHTALPIAHYHQSTFRMACEMTGQSDWAREENLILMTRKRLWRLAAPINRSTAVGYTGLLMGPFSSNLFLAIH
jgi:hypothetical protein